MTNPFVHLELNTPDLTKAKDFYTQLFGWKFEDMDTGPGGIYSIFKPDNGPGGGLMSVPDAPTSWLAYVGVEDIHQATDKARSLGARVVCEAQPVPGHGVLSILLDPTGARIALWQPKSS